MAIASGKTAIVHYTRNLMGIVLYDPLEVSELRARRKWSQRVSSPRRKRMWDYLELVYFSQQYTFYIDYIVI